VRLSPLDTGTAERAAAGALAGSLAAGCALALILYPLSWRHAVVAVIGGVLGALIYAVRPPIVWLVLGVVALAWAIVAWTPLAKTLTDGLVRRDPLPAHVDAVVVLSGSVTADGLLGGEALDRLLTGFALIRRGEAATLILTEPHEWEDTSITAAGDQRRLLQLLATPPRVLTVDRVTSTRTEALGAARVAPPARVPTIALVTSPLHTRRAGAVFEKVGYRVFCVPSESRDIALHSLATASDRINAFRMAVYERVGYWDYRWHGWV